jgi:hypothetical protein
VFFGASTKPPSVCKAYTKKHLETHKVARESVLDTGINKVDAAVMKLLAYGVITSLKLVHCQPKIIGGVGSSHNSVTCSIMLSANQA